MAVMPKKLGDAVDKLYEARQARLELQRAQEEALAKLEKTEADLEEHVTALLSAQGLESARGDIASVTRTTKTVGKIVDFAKLWKWAVKQNDPAIFQKRLANEHFKDLIKGGKAIPGTESVTLHDLSINKAGTKVE